MVKELILATAHMNRYFSRHGIGYIWLFSRYDRILHVKLQDCSNQLQQVIVGIASDVAKAYPLSSRTRYKDAARTLRIPYWDWIRSPKLPFVATIPQIEIYSPRGHEMIDNPLFNYTFHPGVEGNRFPQASSVWYHFMIILLAIEMTNAKHDFRWHISRGLSAGMMRRHKKATKNVPTKL